MASSASFPWRSSWIWDEHGWRELESRVLWEPQRADQLPGGVAPILVSIFHPNEFAVYAQEEDMDDGPNLDQEIEAEEQIAEAREGHGIRDMPVAGDEEQERAAEELPGEDHDRGLTERDKKMVKELHSKMGHPANADFARMLRLARARTPVWRYAQKEFECDICKGQQRPNKGGTPICSTYMPGARTSSGS